MLFNFFLKKGIGIRAREINPNTPPELIELAFEAINSRSNIRGEVSIIKQVTYLK